MARTIAKDHEQKRRHILQTAARVFAQEGIARASVNQLALACGISKANIYHYYGSKDDLLFDILDTYLSQLNARVQAVPIADLAPKDALQRLLTEFLLAYEGMDHEHKIQTEGLPLLPAPQQDVLRSYQREMVQLLSGTIGHVAPDVFRADAQKLRDTTMSVFGMLNWFYMWNRDADEARRREYASLITRLSVNGLSGL